ncbi:MAG: putative transposase orfB for insertion sequence element [Parcubacteria group bacterium Gr01-1014_18]|nr:MAG: putative transposase orfB for insertion sequence element [Parcubacteria group bacterium Greene0416_36]TSC79856.1 MAG: putative transposase orfB for insertion sequence element [Parcubacteria group bacterium Gr01-1014_18]TSC98288.1 MAG: putative transposase orfB for insertion sequence element [Parcubacteria group bacterium Greene1014_20]TSD06671.1 MAG: putative transposase orfB for insertion sequence element [Parcubacteria group bacterium Greene0714_2]
MPQLTKKETAKKMGVSRSSLYYESKKEKKDLILKAKIEEVLKRQPRYGHKRVAMDLSARDKKVNKKRVLRVMKIYDLHPKIRIRRHRKKDDENKPAMHYSNLIKDHFPTGINQVWVSDFTYIWYEGKFIYLATIIDLFSREVVGSNIMVRHDVNLIRGALKNALNQKKPPQILHSDQGSEYCSKEYLKLAESFGIKISMSHKGSPWENGYQESFYGKFKDDLGKVSQFEAEAQLIGAIYNQIYIYNNERIHTALKMPPKQFAELNANLNLNFLSTPHHLVTTVSNKMGT